MEQKLLSNFSREFSYSIWKIERSGEFIWAGEGETPPSYFQSLKKIDDLAPYLKASLDETLSWFKLLLEPPFSFDDIVKIMPEDIEVESKKYTIHILQGENDLLYLILKELQEHIVLSENEQDKISLATTIKKITENKIYFNSFLDEFQALCYDLEKLKNEIHITSAEEMETFLSRIHTIKGSSSIFGIDSVVHCCQNLESSYHSFQNDIIEQDVFYQDFHNSLDELLNAQGVFLKNIKEIYGQSSVFGETSPIAKKDLIHFYNLLMRKEAKDKFFDLFLKKRIVDCLAPYNEVIGSIAFDLGKRVDRIIFSNRCQQKVDSDYFYYATEGIVHLFRNAITHGIENPEERLLKNKKEAGKIFIDAYTTEKELKIILKDDGKGIPKNKIDDILKAGYSSSESHNSHSGLGLGLSYFYSRVLDLGGKIEIQSEEDEGTEFHITLPLKDRIDHFISQLNSPSDFSNIRKLDTAIAHSSILAGHKEPLISILNKMHTFSQMYYIDIDSESAATFSQSLKDSSFNSIEDVLTLLHLSYEKSQKKVFNIDEGLTPALSFLEDCIAQKRKARRVMNRARMVLDELYNNALTISESHKKKQVTLQISINEEDLMMSIVDTVGQFQLYDRLERLKHIFINGLQNSIVGDKNVGAGIGLPLVILNSIEYGVVKSEGIFTVSSAKIPFSRKSNSGIKTLFFKDNRIKD